MLVKRYTAHEARQNLADILGTVYYTHEPVIVERRGRAMAVLISPEDYALLEREKQRSFDVVQRIQERNADASPDEVLRDVTEVVEQVRQEQHDKRQSADQGSH